MTYQKLNEMNDHFIKMQNLEKLIKSLNEYKSKDPEECTLYMFTPSQTRVEFKDLEIIDGVLKVCETKLEAMTKEFESF